MRSADYLARQQVPFETLPHAPAPCASKRARNLRLPGREVAKAVLLVGPDGYLLAVLAATHEIDLKLLAASCGGSLRLARAEEIGRVFPDCERGAVPAFGSLYGLPTLLDSGLTPEEVVLEAGSQFAGVRLALADFERLSGALRLEFARPIKPKQT
jgi:Ala-tRNA(Pro) deacylase